MAKLLLFLFLAATFAVVYLLYANCASLNDWLMGLFTYFIAVATTLALFQDWLRSLIWHPELDLTIESKPPDSHKTSAYYAPAQDIASNRKNPLLFEAPCFYYRLRIHNRGRVAAREVEVYAMQVQRKSNTGEWGTVERFDPQYLVWSYLKLVYLPILPPRSARHCDLGHVISPKSRKSFDTTENDENVLDDNETILSLDVSVKPLRRGHLLPKGEYRISLEVAASNAEPRTFRVVANNPGTWYDAEGDMLTKGVTVRLAN